MKVFGLFFVLIFGGCSVKVPSVTNYTINTNVKIKQNVDGCKRSSIKISKAFAPNYLSMKDIFYVVDGKRQLKYNEAMWAISPKEMVTTEFEKMLKSSSFYGAVIDYKSRARADFIVEINIDDFMQYYNKELDKSYVVVTLSLNLIKSASSKVVLSKTFMYKVDSKELDVDGGVDALKTALSKVLIQIEDEFVKRCR